MDYVGIKTFYLVLELLNTKFFNKLLWVKQVYNYV